MTKGKGQRGSGQGLGARGQWPVASDQGQGARGQWPETKAQSPENKEHRAWAMGGHRCPGREAWHPERHTGERRARHGGSGQYLRNINFSINFPLKGSIMIHY